MNGFLSKSNALGRSRLLLFVALILLMHTRARAESIESVVNPKHANNTWVSDMASVLDSSTEQRLNTLLNNLERDTGAEMAVVTIRQTDGATPKQFASRLFKRWGIGKKSSDNGVLMLLVLEARRIEVETGDGMSSILPRRRSAGRFTARRYSAFQAERLSGRRGGRCADAGAENQGRRHRCNTRKICDASFGPNFHRLFRSVRRRGGIAVSCAREKSARCWVGLIAYRRRAHWRFGVDAFAPAPLPTLSWQNAQDERKRRRRGAGFRSAF